MAARWMTFGAVNAPRKSTEGSRSALPVAAAADGAGGRFNRARVRSRTGLGRRRPFQRSGAGLGGGLEQLTCTSIGLAELGEGAIAKAIGIALARLGQAR